jgi:hypothetical protein
VRIRRTPEIVSERCRGILRVTDALLLQVLGLPAGTKINNVRLSFERPGDIELSIEHPDLPEVPTGNILPVVTAELKAELIDGPANQVRFVRWLL